MAKASCDMFGLQILEAQLTEVEGIIHMAQTARHEANIAKAGEQFAGDAGKLSKFARRQELAISTDGVKMHEAFVQRLEDWKELKS